LKKIILLIYLFCYFQINGQITVFDLQANNQLNAKLDGRNGFKDFKFGDSISNYKNRLAQVGDNPEELELSVDEPSSLFGLKWEKAYFLSEKQRLKGVAVFWKDNKETYKTLLHNLEKIYGKSFSPKIKKLQKDGFDVNAWQGNTIKMILYRDNKNTSTQPCENCKITLAIYCMKFPEAIEIDF
jgi:hypothetical protein